MSDLRLEVRRHERFMIEVGQRQIIFGRPRVSQLVELIDVHDMY